METLEQAVHLGAAREHILIAVDALHEARRALVAAHWGGSGMRAGLLADRCAQLRAEIGEVSP